MGKSLHLNLCHAPKLQIFINRSHGFLHSIALIFLIYYRASFLLQDPKTRAAPLFLWLLVFASELLLSFIWLLGQAFRWLPVSRTVFPERLPKDEKLPPVDVFICTADPDKEPIVDVMNTVLSAMALDYPAQKLHVYLSDDGGAAITLLGMREACRFARYWLPFCKRFGIKTRCPKAYFSSASEDDDISYGGEEFMAEKQIIQEKYEVFKEHLLRSKEDLGFEDTNNITTTRDHPALIEVIQENSNEMPLVVYVSREKRPSHPHNFKAGALNALLRVSGVISNSPYVLVLDCDMYCNDPTSARQAMCFYLDSNISSSLAFVQFPQRFHNFNKTDIHDDGLIRSTFEILWHGMDGLKGPVLSGSGFYMNRDSVCGNFIQKGNDLTELKDAFGLSNEFIKSLGRNYKANVISDGNFSSTCLQETKLLASCSYESHTKWGEEASFLYLSVTEDVFTGYMLHCKGWISVYLNPLRPQFLGTWVTNLNDLLIQGTRWSSGLVDIGISRFFPLRYATLRMSFLESICYAEISLFPLFYSLTLWCFAIIPQLGLLSGISLYPEVSNSFFPIFATIFLSAISKHLYEVLISGGSIQTWRNEQRIWMMKSVSSHVYGSLDAIMKKLGVREASFLPTNKVEDDENSRLYQMGKFDFQTSTRLLVPMVTVAILNMVSFLVGVVRIKEWNKNFVPVFLSFYILVINYAIIEGMIIRKDKGRIPASVTLLSTLISFCLIFLSLIGSIIFL
ncbi:cellulose synthase-like protein G2 [Hevea brasiliensis]|uniref:cellulose synthase-like protein G2 n=1 Tax=Hevea brasiliensis TaxID=3981 RepID=UPI0025D77050|nr:cellulose synthase-like protein G2 [Hevea brasiliensis]